VTVTLSSEALFLPSMADETAGEGEERFVDFVAAVVADEESFELVEPGECPFDDPAVAAEAGAVIGAAAGDFGCDAAAAELAAVASFAYGER